MMAFMVAQNGWIFCMACINTGDLYQYFFGEQPRFEGCTTYRVDDPGCDLWIVDLGMDMFEYTLDWLEVMFEGYRQPSCLALPLIPRSNPIHIYFVSYSSDFVFQSQ